MTTSNPPDDLDAFDDPGPLFDLYRVATTPTRVPPYSPALVNPVAGPSGVSRGGTALPPAPGGTSTGPSTPPTSHRRQLERWAVAAAVVLAVGGVSWWGAAASAASDPEYRRRIAQAEQEGKQSAITSAEEAKEKKEREGLRRRLHAEILRRLELSIDFVGKPAHSGDDALVHRNTLVLQNLCRKAQYDKDGTLAGPVFGVYPEFEARPTTQLLAELAAIAPEPQRGELHKLLAELGQFAGRHYGFTKPPQAEAFGKDVREHYPRFIASFQAAR